MGRLSSYTGKAALGRGGLMVGVIVTVLIYFSAPPAGGQSDPESAARAGEQPRRTLLTSAGLTIRAALGNRCLYDRPAGEEPRNILCTDTLYNPLPTRAALPVRGGNRLVIRTGAPAKRVSVYYDKPNRARTAPVGVLKGSSAQRMNQAGLRWKIKLPRKIRAARVIRVGVKFRDGANAVFGARISSTRRCRKTN